MSWLWWGLGAWIAMDLLIAAAWSRHRRREKQLEARSDAVRQQLKEIGRLRQIEADRERDITYAQATRQRLVAAAALRTTIPHQTRRTEDNQ